MCEEHAAAGVACPSMESIGSAVLEAPKAIIGITLGVCTAVAVGFVVANALWFGLGVLAVAVTVGTLLTRSAYRNLRDGRATWHPDLALTRARVNTAPRPAVAPPRRTALEAPKPQMPSETARALAELAGAIIPVQAAARAEIAAVREAGYRAFDAHGRRP